MNIYHCGYINKQKNWQNVPAVLWKTHAFLEIKKNLLRDGCETHRKALYTGLNFFVDKELYIYEAGISKKVPFCVFHLNSHLNRNLPLVDAVHNAGCNRDAELGKNTHVQFFINCKTYYFNSCNKRVLEMKDGACNDRSYFPWSHFRCKWQRQKGTLQSHALVTLHVISCVVNHLSQASHNPPETHPWSLYTVFTCGCSIILKYWSKTINERFQNGPGLCWNCVYWPHSPSYLPTIVAQ